jgi:tetratricopeptide (TPR) repeat protein
LAFLHEGEGEDALAYAKEAVELTRKAFESFNSDEPSCDYYSACYYLAGLHDSHGQLDRAEPLYASVLAWVQAQGSSGENAYLNVASRLAGVLARQEKPREALDLYNNLCELYRKTLGNQQLFYANNLRCMAILHKRLQENAEAEALMLDSIKIRRKGVDNITTDALFLIEMYLQEGKNEKVLEMLVYILMQNSIKQPEYEETMKNLSKIFAETNNGCLKSLLAELENLINQDKLKPIIEKWTEWEKL